MTLASGGCYTDQTIRIWEVSSVHITERRTGHTREVNSIAYSPDGRTLASGSDDNTVRIWDVSSRECLATLAGHTSSCAERGLFS